MPRRILSAALAALLAAAPLYADDAEDKAAQAVMKLGGSVVRDDKDPAHPVVGVDFTDTPVTDAGLQELADLRGLKTLDLNGCRGVTDAGLKELAALQGLMTLSLRATSVTDAGLKELAALKGLRTLNLTPPA